MTKKLDFQARISDVEQINPLFSTCKIRVLYTGKNRNMSIITKDSVEKALPTLKNIPIVGEFSEENQDYKGHGGAIDLDSYKYIHTTKPYGIVPESATYEWEEVRGREYLTINGCLLWTGRYEEAYSIVEKGKGQSMEIEVMDGQWVEEEEAYRIDSFVFSGLCILGDDVEPAFEDANIVAYSLDKDSFKKEFSIMLDELKSFQKEEKNTVLKELLKKYSLTIEQLTEKGINFNEISEDELERKIIEAFEIDTTDPEGENVNAENPDKVVDEEAENVSASKGENDNLKDEGEDKHSDDEQGDDKLDFEARIKELESELETANSSLEAKDNEIANLTKEVEGLKEFKVETEKREHENKVQEMFINFQLNEEDVEGLNIHEFSLEELEEKCYAIIGKKMASKKNFSKKEAENTNLPIGENSSSNKDEDVLYGGIIEKYRDK